MLISKIARLFAALLLLPFALLAQVTTSSVSGTVKTSKGDPLVGATVTVTHIPTGTTYTVTSRTGGRYNMYNLLPGGPYTISVSFVGFEQGKKDEIQLALGENSIQDFTLTDKTSTLTEVVVGGKRSAPPSASATRPSSPHAAAATAVSSRGSSASRSPCSPPSWCSRP